jgi:hypothetical protein
MSLVIHDVPQGEPEWHALRRGRPTASNFAAILAKSEQRAMRTGYLRKLAAEMLTGETMPEGYVSPDMRRGSEQEAAARDAYVLVTDAELTRVGIGIDDELCGGVGASPDSLIGDDGGLEIKSARPDILIGILKRETIPPEHMAQVQGNMLVFARSYWDLVVYAPKMPLARFRVPRDEEYCARLAKEIAAFNQEKAELVDWVRRYGG